MHARDLYRHAAAEVGNEKVDSWRNPRVHYFKEKGPSSFSFVLV